MTVQNKIFPGVSIFRQSSGVVGTAEVQIFHNGTNGVIQSMSGKLVLTPGTSSNVVIGTINWPVADGAAFQALVTDGAGQLSWSNVVLKDQPIILDGGNPTTTFTTPNTLYVDGGTVA